MINSEKMKTKLLKSLRRKAKSEITIYSITTKSSGGVTIGMSYGYNSDCYSELFQMGDTEKDVMQKVFRIYLNNNIERLRKKYKKYSVHYSKQTTLK